MRTDGPDVVLKVTAAGAEQRNARRELAFYRTLAGRVPVRTPRLLEHADTDELTAIVLSAHAPARPAKEWTRARWLETARQLASLHTMPVPDGDPWVTRPWVRGVLERPRTKVAEDYWSAVAADGLRGVIDASGALARAVDAVPACFTHGDCHVDNLLRDGDQIVWTDWQVTGVGCPAGDLAFLWGRANSDGADPPYDTMVREYSAHRDVDPVALHSALVATELGTLLYGWPDYAGWHTQDERDRVTRRFRQLASDWQRVS